MELKQETDLAKLTTDAKLARMLGEAASLIAVDNGSCNLDAMFYPLDKGERAAPIIAAFQAAGLRASPCKWLGRGVMVQPPGSGQAGKRHAANEAMRQSLERAGWPVCGFYQMD